MFVFPLRWFPWLSLLVGGYMVGSGTEDLLTGLILILVGGVWLFVRFTNRKN